MPTSRDREDDPGTPQRSWTFLTNHGHVLLAIARTPDLRIRDIADLVGVTERTAIQILSDLEQAGYVERQRTGRRNRYTVVSDQPLRHPLEDHHPISVLVQALAHRDPGHDGQHAPASQSTVE